MLMMWCHQDNHNHWHHQRISGYKDPAMANELFQCFSTPARLQVACSHQTKGLSSGCYWKKTEEIFVLKLQLQPSVKCSQCQLQLFTLIKVELMRHTGPVFTKFTLYCEPHFQFRGCKFPETRRFSDQLVNWTQSPKSDPVLRLTGHWTTRAMGVFSYLQGMSTWIRAP